MGTNWMQHDFCCLSCLVPFRLAVSQPIDGLVFCPLCASTCAPFLRGGETELDAVTDILRMSRQAAAEAWREADGGQGRLWDGFGGASPARGRRRLLERATACLWGEDGDQVEREPDKEPCPTCDGRGCLECGRDDQ